MTNAKKVASEKALEQTKVCPTCSRGPLAQTVCPDCRIQAAYECSYCGQFWFYWHGELRDSPHCPFCDP